MKDRILRQRDVDRCMIPLIVLYDHPEDHPGVYVARLFDADNPTPAVMISGDLDKLRADIEKNIDDAVFMRRSPRDDPKIIGTYLIC